MTDLAVPSRVLWTSRFLLAVATHVAPMLPWLWLEPDALAGAGGRELDVISFILADPASSRRGKSNRRYRLSPLLQISGSRSAD